MSFQLFGVLYAAYAASKPAKMRQSAQGLMAVLTASTFLFTCDVLNAPMGAYALSHNESGTPASVIGTHGSKLSNYVFLLFSGLVVCDVANVALTMLLPLEHNNEDDAASGGQKTLPTPDANAV